MKAKLLFLIFCLGLALLFSGCGGEEAAEPVSRSEFALDTLCTVTLYDPSDPELLDEAFALIAAEEALLSRTVEGSDVWRVNQAAGESVTVKEDTAELIALGLEYSELSHGVFDITVGRLTELWDFGGANHVPAEWELPPVLASVDYHNLRLDGSTVTLSDPEARLELGAVAKGYIADRVARLLKDGGAKSAVIDLGGNVVTLGQKPGGEAWKIGCSSPSARSAASSSA